MFYSFMFFKKILKVVSWWLTACVTGYRLTAQRSLHTNKKKNNLWRLCLTRRNNSHLLKSSHHGRYLKTLGGFVRWQSLDGESLFLLSRFVWWKRISNSRKMKLYRNTTTRWVRFFCCLFNGKCSTSELHFAVLSRFVWKKLRLPLKNMVSFQAKHIGNHCLAFSDYLDLLEHISAWNMSSQ